MSPFERDGTRGRTRTVTLLRAADFESAVSTDFTTLALSILRANKNNYLALSGGNYTFAKDNGKPF